MKTLLKVEAKQIFVQFPKINYITRLKVGADLIIGYENEGNGIVLGEFFVCEFIFNDKLTISREEIYCNFQLTHLQFNFINKYLPQPNSYDYVDYLEGDIEVMLFRELRKMGAIEEYWDNNLDCEMFRKTKNYLKWSTL